MIPVTTNLGPRLGPHFASATLPPSWRPAVVASVANRPFTSKSESKQPIHKSRHRSPTPQPPPPGTRSLQVLRRETAATRPALMLATSSGTHLVLTESRVHKHFSQFGAVEDVRIPKDPDTFRPKSWGLVQFAAHSLVLPRPPTDMSEDPVEKAIKAGEEVVIDGVAVVLRPAVVRLWRDNAVGTEIDDCGFRGFAASYKVPYRPLISTE
ncbi:hypothetical protein BCR44DRAFT_48530 [Catenaria anguillulae PL171]|uniref:RRM domain-containing protein n=1 Tax=Catenaria anguillulae PL171 TaxID=765915 RepID=A0A1Y2HW86_9FUNG|nr:hypothetical protein BCR44DRAFT_48530 [Catenaria anguillulae PL171]